MSDLSQRLLIDIGNSRIKVAFTKGKAKGEIGPVHTVDDLLAIRPLSAQAEHVLISSVGQKQQTEQLTQWLSPEKFTLVQTSKQAHGIEFVYEDMSRLGVDRWLAMIAARKRHQGNIAVLDLGTAMTCDLVTAQGQHVGGWIAPGFTTLKKSLLANTEQIQCEHQSYASGAKLGSNTQECVDFGCQALVEGFVHSARKQLGALGSPYCLVISGGDARLFDSMEQTDCHIYDNLVLMGLSYL